MNEPRYVLPLLHLLLAEAQMPRHIQRSKRILPLFPSNTGLADNKFKHKLRKFLPSSGNTPAVSSRSPLKELTLVSKQTVTGVFYLPYSGKMELGFKTSSSTSLGFHVSLLCITFFY